MAEESGEAKVAAHGVLMIVAFLFLAHAAETIAIWASNKVSDWGSRGMARWIGLGCGWTRTD